MSHRNAEDLILTYLGFVFVNPQCYLCMDKCQLGGDANDIDDSGTDNVILAPWYCLIPNSVFLLSFTFHYASTVCLMKLHFFICRDNYAHAIYGQRLVIAFKFSLGSPLDRNKIKQPQKLKQLKNPRQKERIFIRNVNDINIVETNS